MNAKQLLKDTEGKIEKLGDEVKTTSRSVFMAGLGVFSEADEQGRGIFQTLVSKGREVQDRQKDRLDEALGGSRQRVHRVREWASGTVQDSIGSIGQRSTELLQRLGVPTYEDIRTLNQKVAELNEKVEALGNR